MSEPLLPPLLHRYIAENIYRRSEQNPPTVACVHTFVRLETVERRYWIIARSARPLNLKFDENPSSKSSTAPAHQFPFALNFYYHFFSLYSCLVSCNVRPLKRDYRFILCSILLLVWTRTTIEVEDVVPFSSKHS